MNPITLCNEIEQRYRRYLETTFYFKDPILRKSFKEALAKGYLSKGPFIEATPVFKKGIKTGELLKELITDSPDAGFLKSLQGERPLYLHQETAIRKVIKDNQNIVVTTGTASGKTETFLYSILIHLYREFQEGKLGPGTRALILYPMNALANDQRDRLGKICQQLEENNSKFNFTYGQYIGTTPEDEDDKIRNAQDSITHRLPGELVLRREMRESPPHILLTNYSMLEYLLIRPDDSPLFDNGNAKWWRFIVLDEAHQYRGAKGIEMGMLIRRLKRRLIEGGRNQPFNCIATSATIAGSEKDKSTVAKFASELFGEPFEREDIVFGEQEAIISNRDEIELAAEEYIKLGEAMSQKSIDIIKDVANHHNIKISKTYDLQTALGVILQNDSRSTKIRQSLNASPKLVTEFSRELFPELEEPKSVGTFTKLIELLLNSKCPTTETPLISTRYHLFLRSLEGAFISFIHEKCIYLEKAGSNGNEALFEVALCRECGQHYLVGRLTGGKLCEAIRDSGHPEFGATFFRPVNENEYEEPEEGNGDHELYELCVSCGAIVKQGDELNCGHSNSIIVEQQEGADEREDQIPKCSACGYSARDPVREVIHGADGPHSVIATTLVQKLPEDRKKVLAFADSRQEAAFFAWYLENSYKGILSRNLVNKIIKSFKDFPEEGISLESLADKAFYDKKDNFKDEQSDDELKIKKNIWQALYREFLTDEIRISLEGVGLVRWQLKLPERLILPEILFESPLSLNKSEAEELLFILLDFVRRDRAVELRMPPNVSLSWNDLNLQVNQLRLTSNEGGRIHRDEKRWSGKRGKRFQILIKLLTQRGLNVDEASKYATEILRHFWDAVVRLPDSQQLLLQAQNARRLNPNWWRCFPVSDDETIYQCDKCARIQTVFASGICLRHKCSGNVHPIRIANLETNHYRLLYQEDLPDLLRAEEHTAQIERARAHKLQDDFKNGNIQVLSCSTTFELGVDLGDLDTIFLRNVPPEAFNYAQRVGRAGRRSIIPGFAVTYCKRSSHDLYHFQKPEETIIKGKVRPPVISLCNEKIITRHITAVALSFFFRAYKKRFKNIETLFTNLEEPSFFKDFSDYLDKSKSIIAKSIESILPSEMLDKFGIENDHWIELIAGENSMLANGEAETLSDYKRVKQFENESSQRGNYKKAEWARNRARTIAGEDTLSFLSRKAIIPKYGFPVDVVELDLYRVQQISNANEVILQRDLSIAIAEYAPTSKIIANKMEWTSYGVKKVLEKEWPKKNYFKCTKHNFFICWDEGTAEPSNKCCNEAVKGTYIIPQFGFVTNLDKPKPPSRRPQKIFTSRPYFLNMTIENPEEIDFKFLRLKKASPGKLLVLCEGRRGESFHICNRCGAGFRDRVDSHKTPFGENCGGALQKVALGHEFTTDVLQLNFNSNYTQTTDMGFAYSLAYALLEGCAVVLEVPPSDLNATVAYAGDGCMPPIVLYDNVPGGAGLVAQLEDEQILYECLQQARLRVNGDCGCSEEDSCYGCLRSYRNQFIHPLLRRGPVLHYLDKILSDWER